MLDDLGHARDMFRGPPRGMEVTLQKASDVSSNTDTIVMANLGYFQLKANPGVWQLRLHEGPSMELYKIVEITEHGNVPEDPTHLVVNSFRGKTVNLVVRKREGAEDRSLSELNQKEVKHGFWNSVSR